LVLRSADDALPGYFGDKVVGSDWIQRSDITESDIKKVQFALKNPDFFIKGNTNFGGSIAATLNAFTRTEFFTCYYNATGAPPVQTGNPSWFGIHINSNAIANTGINICWAYVASSLICYERVDLAGVIGTWTLRSSGGGGGDIPTFVSIDASNSPYQALDTATTVIVSTASGDVTVTLPAASLKQYNIKWMLGVNPLTINVAGSGSVDGQASFVVSALYATGTNISLLCEESGTWVVI
jgi:hypothetical protein